MKKLLHLSRNQKGFTLIELLIVVAIIGILAAVVIPNVGQFLVSGHIGAGRAERSTLQVAVDGMMADAGVITIAGGSGWKGEAETILATSSGGITYDASSYLRRFPTEGTYSVDTEGIVTCTAYGGLDTDDLARINE